VKRFIYSIAVEIVGTLIESPFYFGMKTKERLGLFETVYASYIESKEENDHVSSGRSVPKEGA